jgi:MFS family permease
LLQLIRESYVLLLLIYHTVSARVLKGLLSLTQGAFVLIAGRLGAVYGHKNLAILGAVWWVVFTLVSGFVRNFIGHCTVRALSGIGGAFVGPNAIALLTIAIPPGKQRNIAVGFFGAMAPIGAAGGSVWPGFFVQLTDWKWLYFFLYALQRLVGQIQIADNGESAILGSVVFAIFALLVPREPEPMDKNGTIDYFGAFLGVAGLILFNFTWK